MLTAFSVALAVLIVLSVCQVVLFRFINPPLTFSVAWEWARHLAHSEPYRPPAFYWLPMERISPHLRQAVLAAEDQRFTAHSGFDLVEIKAALSDMVADGRIRGASTITMQTARTVFLVPSRNWARKLTEAYYTVLIELAWSKRRILEVYLNTVDWGSGIMGAEAAAQAYFHKRSDALDRRQAALLAAILPSPHRFSPVRPSAYVQQRANRILKDMSRMPLL